MRLKYTLGCIILMFASCYIYFIHYKRQIAKKVSSIGGELIRVERRDQYSTTGPFKIIGKGRRIYRFEYIKDEKTHVGWVRFDMLNGFPNWKI